MASQLEDFLDQTVSLLTNDGKHIIGTLRGVDQCVNLILEESYQRNYTKEGTDMVPLGLYLARGDNVAVIGEVDLALEKQIDFKNLRAQPLKPIIH